MVRLVLGFLLLVPGAFAQTPGQPTADQLFELGQYAEAASAFERLPNTQKTEAVLNRLAICYQRLNRTRDAENIYRRAIREGSNNAALYNNLGAVYYSQRRFPESEAQFRRAAERDPTNFVVRGNLHAAEYARDNSRIARTVAADMAKTEPALIRNVSNDFVGVILLLTSPVRAAVFDHTSRGDSLMARKLYDDAAMEYRKVLALDHYDTYVINRLGIAYLQTKKLFEAEQQYRETLRLDPYFPEALNNLGFIEYTKANYDGALNLYRQSLQIQPRSAVVFMNIAACLFATQNYDDGASTMRQALEIDPKLLQREGSGTLVQGSQPSDPMMQFHMAKLLATRGEADLAINYLSKAVDNGFKDATAIKTDPAFSRLAMDERFTRLLENLNRR